MLVLWVLQNILCFFPIQLGCLKVENPDAVVHAFSLHSFNLITLVGSNGNLINQTAQIKRGYFLCVSQDVLSIRMGLHSYHCHVYVSFVNQKIVILIQIEKVH